MRHRGRIINGWIVSGNKEPRPRGPSFSMSERLELSHSIASNPGIACFAASMAFVLISVINTVAPADENARSNFEPDTRCCRSNENLLIHDALNEH